MAESDIQGESLLLHIGESEQFLRDVRGALAARDRDVSVISVETNDAARERLPEDGVAGLVYESDTLDTEAAGFLGEIRERAPHCPILFLTTDPAVVDDALQAGATDVLVRHDEVDDVSLLARRLDHLLAETDSDSAAAMTEELRDERDFTDQILDALEDVFYVIDEDGSLERWNEQLATVTGYTDDELAGMNALDFFAGEDRDRIGAAIAETIEDGSTNVEAAFVTKEGETIPHEFTGAELTTADGQFRGIVGIGRDISARTELERELRRKASLLDHIFNQVPTALYVKDTEGRHVRMSQYHRDPDGTLGKTDPEIYGESAYTESTYADDMRVIEEGDRIINKEEYNPNDEEWTLTSKVPWRDESGEIQGLIGVSRLITEKKEFERKLNLRNRAMEEAPIGITIHDAASPEREIVYANTGFRELTDYEQSAVEGDGLAQLTGPETDGDRISALDSAFDDGAATSEVLVLYRADGSPFWGRISIAPVTDEDGELTHFVGFLQDVTDTKEHAEEIERRLDEFGELIADELRTPLQDAEASIRQIDANGSSDEVDAAIRSIQHVDKLIDDIATVHSFSVKSREVFETVELDGGDAE